MLVYYQIAHFSKIGLFTITPHIVLHFATLQKSYFYRKSNKKNNEVIPKIKLKALKQ